MRHLGHILVMSYAGAALVLQYFVSMANSQGIAQSGPWVLAMVVAFLFVLAAGFKAFRSFFESLAGKNDDVSLSEFDFPDSLLFGLFTLFVLANFVAHCVLAALADTAGSIWFGTWVLADVLVGIVAFVIWKVTIKAQLRARSNGPRSVRDRDAA